MLVNFLYQGLYQILVLILPLITIPYTSRVLGVEGIGIYSYSYAVVSYFVSFANMGISIYGNREIAAMQDDKERRSQCFWDLFALQGLFASIAVFFYIVIILMGDWENKFVFVVQGLYIIGQGIDINWFFFGMEKFKITVIRNLFIKIITTILVFVLIKSSEDLILYILILALGTVIGNSVVWVFIKEYVILRKPILNNIRKFVKPIIILMIPSFAVKMYTQMDKIFIEFFSDFSQVGYYENAEKIIQIAFVLITALSTVILPRMASLNAKQEKEKFINVFNRVISCVVWLTSALMFGILGIADNFVTIYLGEEYSSCNVLVMILAITIPFKGCAEIIRRGYIIPTKRDDIYIVSIFCGAGVNIIINLLLMPKFGAVGAAIGTVIAEITVCLIQVMKIRKQVPIIKCIRENMIYIIIGIVMFGCVSKVSLYISELPLIGVMILQILIGIIVYVVGTGAVIILKYRNNRLLLKELLVEGRKK